MYNINRCFPTKHSHYTLLTLVVLVTTLLEYIVTALLECFWCINIIAIWQLLANFAAVFKSWHNVNAMHYHIHVSA